jgi:hypothetical protein
MTATKARTRRWLAPIAALLAACGTSKESQPASGVGPAPPEPGPDAEAPYVPPPESCAPADVDSPELFAPCSTGSGVFGTWTVDELGLPAYEYGLDQNADERASFFNTEGKDRRDHWAAFGNARVNAMFFNDGYVEVTTQDRGPTYLNKLDGAQGNWAGGFGWLDDGGRTWCTAYKWRPEGAKTLRRFGMGYALASTSYRGIALSRTAYSPAGDAPVVVDEVTIENRGAQPKSLRHYEYWDVARRQVEISWLVSGIPVTTAPAGTAKHRDERNALFVESVRWDPVSRALVLRRAHAGGVTPPAPETPSNVDYYPGDPFLAVLSGDVADVYTDQASFFGAGGVAAPDAVTARASGHGVAGSTLGAEASGAGQPRMFVVRSDLSLAPGEVKKLRFAYGYAPFGQAPAVDPSWSEPSRDLRKEQAEALREHLMYFAADRDPVLHRELAWHAYQVETSVAWREYWKGRVVPQGSAYLYLHGADGAARDLGLFALPLVYTHPALAREELMLFMGTQFAADKRFSYAFQGHGQLDDAGGVHAKPSDLPIFFLWAISEYVGATGDTAWLDAPAPYWPREALPSATVWDHVRDAVRHLFDVVGTGEHGLVRVQTGDWSDGIVFEAPDRALAIDKGESVPNTQMAAAVLPRVADLVEERDAALATEIRTRVKGYRAAVHKAWTGSWFGRAYFGDGKLAYASTLNLEAQVWALIGEQFAAPGDRDALLQAIVSKLDSPSPAGAVLVGGGQVWPAISGLLTWGYSLSSPQLGWDHLVRNTMAAHALAYPSVWYGIWSGPDGLNGPGGKRPGEAWYSPVTPMVDFPVMNNNQHAMPMLAAIRVAGIDATARGLRIAPRVPGRVFSLRTHLVDLSQRGSVIRGTYRGLGAGSRRIEVDAPAGAIIESASVDGAAVSVQPGASSVALDVLVTPGSGVGFEVRTVP